MDKFLNSTFIKFLIVGLVNTGVGTAVMFLLYWLGAGYWVSSAANYIVGSVVSYFLNKYYTFRQKKQSLPEMLRFAVHISLCYLIAYGVAKPVGMAILPASSVKEQETLAMLMAMGLFVILNYFGQRYIVFSKRKEG